MTTQEEHKENLLQWFSQLNAREQRILRVRFELDESDKPYTKKQKALIHSLKEIHSRNCIKENCSFDEMEVYVKWDKERLNEMNKEG